MALIKKKQQKPPDGAGAKGATEMANAAATTPPRSTDATEPAGGVFAPSRTQTAADAVLPDFRTRMRRRQTWYHVYLSDKTRQRLAPVAARIGPWVELAVDAVYDKVVPVVDQIVYWEALVDVVLLTHAIAWTWATAWLHCSVLWAGLVWAVTVFAMRTNYARLRTRMRFEAVRAASKRRLTTDSETMEWMNLFLERFWLLFEPWISEQVTASVNATLSAYKPAFLYDLKLTTFTLGSAAPRIETVRTYPNTDDDVISMDWHLTFTPLEGGGREGGPARRDSKIVLTAWLGKGMATVPVPVEVSKVAFNGTANVHLTLGETFPHIRLLDVSLRELPAIDFILRPLKTMDLLNTPLLSQFIVDLINTQLAAFVVAPQKIHINVEEAIAGSDVQDHALGVLRIRVVEAMNLRNTESFRSLPDPYAVVVIGGREVALTRMQPNTLTPFFDETFFVVVPRSVFSQARHGSDEVQVVVRDYNRVKKDAFMGATLAFKLGDSVGPAGAANVPSPGPHVSPGPEDAPDEALRRAAPALVPIEVRADGWLPLFAPAGSTGEAKARGEIRASMTYFPIPATAFVGRTTYRSDRRAGEAALTEEFSTGVVRVWLSQAKELDADRSLHGKLNPFAIVEIDGKRVLQTKVKRRTNSPYWSDSAEVFVKDIVNTQVRVVVKDQRDLASDPVLGTCQLGVFELLSGAPGGDWFRLFGAASGRVRLSIEFVPVAVPEIADPVNLAYQAKWFTKQLAAATGYPDRGALPLGVLRIALVEAQGLRRSDLTTGKADPYVRMRVNGVQLHRTHVAPETLAPQWQEVVFVVVHSLQDRLELTVLDYNAFSSDSVLGCISARLHEVKSGAFSDADALCTAAGVSVDPVGRAGDADLWLNLRDTKRGAGGGVSLVLGQGRLRLRTAFYPLQCPEESSGVLSFGEPAIGEGAEASAVASVTPVPATGTASRPLSVAGSGGGTLDSSLGGDFSHRFDFTRYQCGIVRVRLVEVRLPSGLSSVGSSKTRGRAFVDVLLDARHRVFSSAVRQDASSIAFSDTFECFVVDTATTTIDFRLMWLDGKSGGDAGGASTGPEHKVKKKRARCIATCSLLVQDVLKGRVGFDRAAWFAMVAGKSPSPAPVVPPVGAAASGFAAAAAAAGRGLVGSAAERLAMLGGSFENVAPASIDGDGGSEPDYDEQASSIGSDANAGGSTLDAMTTSGTLPSTLGSSFSDAAGGATGGFALRTGFGFMPVDVGDAAHTFQEQGVVEVIVHSARNLPAADRRGTSDPFVVVSVNDHAIFRTSIFKRELNPRFEEHVSFPVRARNRTTLTLTVFDYNKIEQNTRLGAVRLPLSQLERNNAMLERECPLLDAISGRAPADAAAGPPVLSVSVGFFPQRVAGVPMPTLTDYESALPRATLRRRADNPDKMGDDVLSEDADSMEGGAGGVAMAAAGTTGRTLQFVGRALASAPMPFMSRKRHGSFRGLGKKRFGSNADADAAPEADLDGKSEADLDGRSEADFDGKEMDGSASSLPDDPVEIETLRNLGGTLTVTVHEVRDAPALVGGVAKRLGECYVQGEVSLAAGFAGKAGAHTAFKTTVRKREAALSWDATFALAVAPAGSGLGSGAPGLAQGIGAVQLAVALRTRHAVRADQTLATATLAVFDELALGHVEMGRRASGQTLDRRGSVGPLVSSTGMSLAQDGAAAPEAGVAYVDKWFPLTAASPGSLSRRLSRVSLASGSTSSDFGGLALGDGAGEGVGDAAPAVRLGLVFRPGV